MNSFSRFSFACLSIAAMLLGVTLIINPPHQVAAQSLGTSHGCPVQGGTGTTASTNATACKGGAAVVTGIRAISTSATLAFLRLYNIAGGLPTCSSSTGFVESIPIPASTTGAGFIDTPVAIADYPNGLGYCVTGGSGNNDNTNAPTGVFITVKFQ